MSGYFFNSEINSGAVEHFADIALGSFQVGEALAPLAAPAVKGDLVLWSCGACGFHCGNSPMRGLGLVVFGSGFGESGVSASRERSGVSGPWAVGSRCVRHGSKSPAACAVAWWAWNAGGWIVARGKEKGARIAPSAHSSLPMRGALSMSRRGYPYVNLPIWRKISPVYS